ncbi:leucyl aminopeptidase [Paenibacillus chitinolyticus]|uniref:Probable cytosol aminopeptidase n=1 Tax=Paenibacillus chitinolyticus TaxID=79263 RepID=A0A410WS11_9BACL|nr:leucyl aminopeptidase [Paenibacillus chitinolyticus]MCY9588999.1 leucyl aminopeptidase [Paenibacillus chitinolyticus]MCY9595453.1 leucyl aminopeptidase [Paenibacillus chitinolyticus]QAV17226.1 leucyl aminopeptidase [Paenibacillus chitinolyticus]
MRADYTTNTKISIAESGGWASADADALLFFTTEGEDPGSLPDLPEELRAELDRLKRAGRYKGSAGEVTVLPAYGSLAAPYVIAAGLGAAPAGRDTLRLAAVQAAREAQRLGLGRLAVLLPEGAFPAEPPRGGTYAAPLAAQGTGGADAARGASVKAASVDGVQEEPQSVSGADARTAAGAPSTGSADERPAGAASAAKTVSTVAEGLLLGAYRIATYAREAKPRQELAAAQLFVQRDALNGEALQAAVAAAEAYAVATNYARDLTNLPGNLLLPSDLAKEAEKLAGQFGIACEVLDEQAIVERGMGALAAVGLGSANPPRMITLSYDGDPSSGEVLGLVGKGVTFDTGGISIKPAGGMEEMISDMGGAAVLLGLLIVVGRLKPRINLRIVIPAAENMPSGTAMRPGDVITTLSGRTVEVLNTDAEGRLILADGVTYAIEKGATRLIDIATLTGAVLVSFADVATSAQTNDDAFLASVLQASIQAGEKVWQLPNFPEYREMLRSTVADIKNAAAHKWAGAIMGGSFIEAFIEDKPWIHLDTGGTAWLWGDRGIDPKGGTGAMVRTLAEYICGAGHGA